MNQRLLFARAFEEEMRKQIPADARPQFHLTPCVGWMNDPNGFSYYKGEYHMFFPTPRCEPRDTRILSRG